MKLFVLHDDPKRTEHWTDRTWLAIWARTGAEAADLFLRHYPGDGEVEAPCDVGVDGIADHPCLPAFAPTQPKAEYRSEVLRLAGFAEESEGRCDGCGLAAMGIEKYAVCDGCNTCRECLADEPPCDCKPDRLMYCLLHEEAETP